MNTLDILRGGSLFATVKLDSGNAVQSKQIMGPNTLQLTFDRSDYIDFMINDTCIVFDEVYRINKLPVVTKQSVELWKYTIVMEADSYFELAKVQYNFLNPTNVLREGDFSLMGNAETFIDLLIENMNRVQAGWTKGGVTSTDYKNLTFKASNCYNALSQIAEEFGTEFYVFNKTIHLAKQYQDVGDTYKQGRQEGLYTVTRLNLDNSNIVTRLYTYGAEKNLPADYFARRLCLPGGYNACTPSSITIGWANIIAGEQQLTINWTPPGGFGITDLMFQWRDAGTSDPFNEISMAPMVPPFICNLPLGNLDIRFRTVGGPCDGILTGIITVNGASILDPQFVIDPIPYLEKNTVKYGIIEHTEYFDDIFPHRTGKVSSINIADPFVFTDVTMDFDVNTHLLPGISAKVTFNTGQLAGYEFELSTYDNGTKEFRILKNKTERLLDIPSVTLFPQIGDEFVLTDIRMPQQYVFNAENELKIKAQALLDVLCDPQLAYKIEFDPVFLKKKNKTIRLGDLLWIKDDQLGVQKKIRVVQFTRNIVEEFRFDVTVSDIVSPGTLSLILAAQASGQRDINGIQRGLTNNSILNNNVIGDLHFVTIKEFADNAAAIAGGLTVGTAYHTAGILKVVI